MIWRRLEEIQGWLEEAGLDGWLLYDFRGLNPLAHRLTHLGSERVTRRWFCLVPREGEPAVLAHAIEATYFPGPARLERYHDRASLVGGLRKLLEGRSTLAMEHSPQGDNPYVGRVDSGTVDLVRALGKQVVSSGDLAQRLLTLSPQQQADHRTAAQGLGAAIREGMAWLRERREAVSEQALARYLVGRVEARGLIAEHEPAVSFGTATRDPHYAPSAHRALEPGQPVLVDMVCKVPSALAPFADITWVAHSGPPSPEFARAFAAVKAAQQRGLEYLQQRFAARDYPEGHEADAAVRGVLEAAGYAPALLHRSGHNLGSQHVHGEAAHLDGWETLDRRRLLPGFAFTLEPGVYLEGFGVRSELNFLTHAEGIEVTTPVQCEIELI